MRLARAVKRLTALAATVGGHSLRAGFVTAADAVGAPIAKVMQRARHARFETTRGYIREADAIRGHAASYLGLRLGDWVRCRETEMTRPQRHLAFLSVFLVTGAGASLKVEAACGDRPGVPVHGCPESYQTEFPPAVVSAQKSWSGCLASSMLVQRTRFLDQNEAAEAAFTACQTEEQGVRAALVGKSHLTPQEAATLLGYLKPQMKQSMLRLTD